MDLRNKHKIEYDNLFFCLSIAFPSVVSLVCQTIRKFIGNTKSLDTLILYGIFAWVIVKVLPKIVRSVNKRDLVLFFFLALAFTFSGFSTIHDVSATRQVILEILRKCVLVYFGAKLVRYSANLNKYLRASAYIIAISVFAGTFVFATAKEGYSQYDGYTLLDGLMFLFVPLISERKVFDFIAAGFMLVMTLLTGARGPMLIGAMLIVSGFLLTEQKKKYNFIRYVVPLALVGIVAKYMREILLFISTLVGDSGSMRTINALLNNELMESDGRVWIMSCAWEYIQNHYLIGCGVVNDRVIICRAINGTKSPVSYYPHNFFLEVGMQFGFILGLALACVFLLMIVKRFLRCGGIHEKLLLIALVFAGFAPLMLSGSYLSWSMFYALIGFCTRSAPFGGISQSE